MKIQTLFAFAVLTTIGSLGMIFLLVTFEEEDSQTSVSNTSETEQSTDTFIDFSSFQVPEEIPELDSVTLEFGVEDLFLTAEDNPEIVVTLRNPNNFEISTAEFVFDFDSSVVDIISIEGIVDSENGFTTFVGNDANIVEGLARISATNLDGRAVSQTVEVARITLNKYADINSYLGSVKRDDSNEVGTTLVDVEDTVYSIDETSLVRLNNAE